MTRRLSVIELDDLALQCARDLAASQPRADYTIANLPTLGTPAPVDLVPVWHQQTNQTVSVTVAALLTVLALGSNPLGFFNVTSAPYNVDPTGVADGTLGFQSAINAAHSNTFGGVVYVPPNCKVTLSATLVSYPNVAIVGGDRQSSILNIGSIAVPIFSITSASGTNWARFLNLTLTGPQGSGISLNGAAYIEIDECEFLSMVTGITWTGCNNVVVSRSRFANLQTGISWGASMLATWVKDCSWASNTANISGSPAGAGNWVFGSQQGLNPSGVITPGAIPASTTPTTNNTGYRAKVALNLVGSTATVIAINGTTVVASPPNGLTFITLNPGDTIALTYSVLGSSVWVWAPD